MKILMISTDRKILERDSAVRQRVVQYGKLVDELNIVIFNSSTRVASSKYQVERILGTNVTLYPTNSRNRWFYIFDAIKISKEIFESREWKVEGNLVTTQDVFETGFVGWWIAKKTGAKLHLQIHTDFLSKYFIKESFLNRVRVCLAKFLLPKADGVRVVSERISQSLKTKNYKLKTEPIVLPIFVDIKNYENKIPAFDLHKKYPQFDFIILMTCRLEKEKNISMAIKVMKKIIKKHPKAGLVIVGDGSLKRKLELSAIGYKLSASIIFEGWQKDLFSYYKTADLFLFTSNYEGYGMSLIEASASGCPILTTDVGLVGGVLKEGDIKVCKTGDKDCFVAEIKKLLKDKLLLCDMSIKARKRIEENVIKDKQEYLNKMKEDWESCLK
ncbi:TPA: hypothetical protein DCZ46_00445 [Candidatus Campbellbacteria bacterium]|nr:MAG: cap, capsular polysaccharide biosynthsis protein [Candidatus Campbellbacteria bacterium GW2011_OD1_34_28]KKP75441.1 MAG: Glycosyltransferase [Candidatus Campbellbacteria bacterium GW2011_GWD2_35_24]KKP75998.1 MAG: capsular polysaccharide biosynthsis protein [Candidatus Campbellbacteria bacterium GW2011_GWC2_35_28]KKP77187.1 MAG: Glycosyltransferase [Candidatus Campbellbacteria bacterium GW2011_GWC1_35_31]KKP79116.1 MAG: Glycosyltransferase [Candidatus Campbellbacteria bacterium GW2011_G